MSGEDMNSHRQVFDSHLGSSGVHVILDKCLDTTDRLDTQFVKLILLEYQCTCQ